MNSSQGNLSRRGFLAKSLAGLTAGAGLPVWFAQESLNAAQEAKSQQKTNVSPNDRVVMGAIGTGTNYTRRGNNPLRGERGIAIMQNAMRDPGVQMVAVCDVDRHNRGFAANLVGNDCRQYEDFRELLANRDIQAVTIGTPDHWHAAIAIAALRAGKDVYCEKPLTLFLDEGKALVRTVGQTGRLLQTGNQQRSEYNGRFRLACELVRNGRIGRPQRIETIVGTNPQGGPFRVTNPPEGLNWDFWLGPRPRVEYVAEKCHYEFRWWFEYSGGKMTDWGAHHNDIGQWALNMDNSGPAEVFATAAPRRTEPLYYNCPPTFEVTFTYHNGPNNGPGTRMVCRTQPSREGLDNEGVLFEGEDGKWIFVSRRRLIASDQRLIDEPLPANATRLEVSSANTGNQHMANFLDCVRSTSSPRKVPICNVNVGHRSVSVCHLGVIALKMNRGPDNPLLWNPQAERFTNSSDANQMLMEPYRAPWRLEA